MRYCSTVSQQHCQAKQLRCGQAERNQIAQGTSSCKRYHTPSNWAAANGGETSGGLRGVWPPFLEIGRNRPFPPFFCFFRPFPEGAKSTWESRKRRKKAFFLRYPQICLNPLLLNPHLRHPNKCLRGVSFPIFGKLLDNIGPSRATQLTPRELSGVTKVYFITLTSINVLLFFSV